ncbi:MAG TPA: RHS repeat-associated core domain-containing protein, partial [Blastocatellia bacterium]|nr:RHS repeat-associated core domain-containing protein [Blastocatellia bacterium]
MSDWLSERLDADTSGNIQGTMGTLPFGEDFAESGSQEKHHFTSYERDGETGLDYANRRVYSSASARFQWVDPYSTSGTATDPQTWNRYAYVMGDPVNSADPSGMATIDKLLPTAAPNTTGDDTSCVPVSANWAGFINLYDCIDGTGGGGGGDPPTSPTPSCKMHVDTTMGDSISTDTPGSGLTFSGGSQIIGRANFGFGTFNQLINNGFFYNTYIYATLVNSSGIGGWTAWQSSSW